MKNLKLYYHLIITIMFVYIFIQFLTLKQTNYIYKFYTDYIMNKYCIIIYISLLFCIMKYDTYTAIILFILIIGPFKCSTKEFFETTTLSNTKLSNTTIPNTTISNIDIEQKDISKIVKDNLLGIDDRFKMDDIKKDEILKQIKAQIDNDPYKTNLSKDIINEIYGKYFDNDIFKKLKQVNDDSKQYIASGNFKYIPQDNKVDYDLVTYQNLSTNTQLGINPISDGIKTVARST